MQYSIEIATNKYVRKFLDKVKKTNYNNYERIMGIFENIYKVGFDKSIKAQVIKQIKGQKFLIHELIVSTPELEYRFMGEILNNKLILVNSFIKKDQKTRKKEIDLTIKRLKDEDLI